MLVLVICVFLVVATLLLLGATYVKSSKAEYPPGLDNPSGVRKMYQISTGLSILGKALEKLGIWSEVGLLRFISALQAKKLGEDPELVIKNVEFEGVPVRIYQPKAPSTGSRKGVMYFHGGGFVFGSIESYDYLCRHISKNCGAVVVSVEYRLAPEHRYPAAYDDCLCASIHFLKTTEEYGVDPSSVIICGDSAGGNLTACVTQTLVTKKDIPKPLAQVLIYPSVQMIDYNLPSYQQNSMVPLLLRDRTIFYKLAYLGANLSISKEIQNSSHIPPEFRKKLSKWLSADNIPDEFKVRGYKPHTMAPFNNDVYQELKHGFDITSSPLIAENAIISQLPKSYLLTCEFDVLRDDGLLYKKRLEDNGVSVTWYNVKNGFHGVLSFFDVSNFNSGKEAMVIPVLCAPPFGCYQHVDISGNERLSRKWTESEQSHTWLSRVPDRRIMGLGLAILAIFFIVFLALCILLLVGIIYFECSNSEIPPGVADPGKLRTIHCIYVGIAVVGRILQNMSLCTQLGFTRYIREKLMVTKLGEDPKLFIKNLTFDGIQVRVYQPRAPSAGGRKGVMFFHGGGWMFGSVDSYDTLCRYIAKETESVFVSVEYRLSPEHRYPAAFDDCLSATVHFLKTAQEYGVDPNSVLISGDSAGGNLTAAICQALTGRPDLPKPMAQILIYPAVQAIDFHLPSYIQNRAVPVLYRERAVFYMIHYMEGDINMMEDILDGDHVPVELKMKYRKWLSADNIPDEFKARGYKPRVMASHSEDVYEAHKKVFETNFSPLLAEDSVIGQLPKAYILTCEFDVLRDDGLLYKKRLEDNGVPVTWYHVRDGFHGIVSFFDSGKLSFNSGKLAVDNIVNYINGI
ncbi:uncharacterized protein PAF06_016030 [Gastrophryne carolinensis]